MLKQIVAALFAASVIAAPAFAAETATSKPAVETSKAATQTGRSYAEIKKHPRHVRHYVRHHRHVKHVRATHVKHAKHPTSNKNKTAAPKSPGQAATTPPAK